MTENVSEAPVTPTEDSVDTQGTEKAPETVVEKSFRDFVVKEDLKKAAERFDSLDSVFENLLEKQKYIDSSVRVPKEGAPEEEWNKYYKAIGVPEKPDEYFKELPEDTPDEVKDRLTRYAETMHGLKANPELVKASYDFLQAEVQAEIDREIAANEKAVQEAETNLRKIWPTQEQYDRNTRIAKAFIEKFGGEELKDYLETSKLGNDPRMLAFAAKAGSLFAEDMADPIIRGKDTNQADSQALESEYAKRTREGTQHDPEFQRRWTEFFNRTYPDD